MKMYILILNDVPDNLVPVTAAHASLACYLEYPNDLEMKIWLSTSFKKVVCSVNQTEFDKAKEAGNYNITTESALGGRVVAITFVPRREFPKCFSFFKLWKPNKVEKDDKCLNCGSINFEKRGDGLYCTKCDFLHKIYLGYD